MRVRVVLSTITVLSIEERSRVVINSTNSFNLAIDKMKVKTHLDNEYLLANPPLYIQSINTPT